VKTLGGDRQSSAERSAAAAKLHTRLRIGIDARAAAEVPAGRGRVVRELLRGLAARTDDHEYVLFARERWDGVELDARFRWQLNRAADPWWHVRAAWRANRECDVFLSCNSYLTVWLLRIPSVPIVYDMTTFESAMRPNLRSTVIERATLGLAVRRATGIVAISGATADALAERFPRAAALTTVAQLGVTSALVDAPTVAAATLTAADPWRAGEVAGVDELPESGFVLAVGTLEPRKNLPRLVEAYRRLPAELQDAHPLVVVGALGWETGETLDALRSLGERAVMLGYTSDQALAELYRRCALFCYPSLGEGFGLPVLEAMAAGAAVLTSNVSSLPEVGGDAVEYANPHDVDGIASALESLLASPQRREELGELARERAKEFSWARMTELTLGAIERAGSRA
jgi:glycosyltransferase involved in cell wall biosynthesis